MTRYEQATVTTEQYVLRETHNFGHETIEVIMRKARAIGQSGGTFPPLEPSVSVNDGIVIERDVPVILRDGTTIYTDIYRPENAASVPAIVAWSPYGKRSGYAGTNRVPGVVAGTYSEAAKEEGPDPAYWCRYGYAVVNPDARGVGNSEGNISILGSGEGRDCADLIDWVGERDWCNGKVGMSGSSWLAMIQFFTAAERPKHLACIAPWEGTTDFYRQILCHGGIPEIVSQGENGLLVPPGDPESLADAIMTVLADPVLADSMGASALRGAVSRFSWDRATDVLLDSYS